MTVLVVFATNILYILTKASNTNIHNVTNIEILSPKGKNCHQHNGLNIYNYDDDFNVTLAMPELTSKAETECK